MRTGLIAWAMVMAFGSIALGDVVTLTNGDKLTGKVGEISAGKMKFNSPVLGEITIDMANIASFTTDEPAEIRLKSGPTVKEKISEATAQSVTTESGQTVQLSDVKVVNPPAEKWSGSVLANLSLARGNTETTDAGIAAEAVLRRMRPAVDDRSTLKGEYNFADVGTGDDRTTTKENVEASAKYDRYFTQKWYGYGIIGYEKDHIADLEYRFTPGIGVGYQWVESPTFNFSTEAGLTYVFERFDPGGSNDFLALRLAYHVDKKLNEKVLLFHNLEYLPSLEEFTDDYLVNADAGIQAGLVKNFFAQAKVEWNYDSTPATGRKQNDYRYLIGVGWRF